MNILQQLSSTLGANNEGPNRAFSAKLAELKDTGAIAEVIDLFDHPDKRVRWDAIKVIMKIAEHDPELVLVHLPSITKLLGGKQNNLIWCAMICLSEVAAVHPNKVYPYAAQISDETGSVITIDAGVMCLAQLARAKSTYYKELFPLLLYQVRICPPKFVPQYSEKTMLAIHPKNNFELKDILEDRFAELSIPQQKRVRKVLQQLGS